jgi:hypothetical protein
LAGAITSGHSEIQIRTQGLEHTDSSSDPPVAKPKTGRQRFATVMAVKSELFRKHLDFDLYGDGGRVKIAVDG